MLCLILKIFIFTETFQTALHGKDYDHCTEKETENRTIMSTFFPFLLRFLRDPEHFLDPRRKDNLERKLFRDYQEWGLIPCVWTAPATWPSESQRHSPRGEAAGREALLQGQGDRSGAAWVPSQAAF